MAEKSNASFSRARSLRVGWKLLLAVFEKSVLARRQWTENE
jgi:hypothetical protein